MTTGGIPGAGWYPDPWFTGQHRYWTGTTWTGDVFPDGPAGGGTRIELRPEHERPPAPPPVQRSATPVPAPTFNYLSSPPAASDFTPWETLEYAPAPTPRWRLTPRQINLIALGTGLVVGFTSVALILSTRNHSSSAAEPLVPSPVPSLPVVPLPTPTALQPLDPDASVLQGLVVRQQDVRAPYSVQLLGGGNEVVGQTTLDLCNGNYPSESLRTARLQVVEYDAGGGSVFSTEAVLYRNARDAQQAMQEVRSVAAGCPDRPVVSPVQEPTVTTHFGAAPDRGWPKVADIDRAAYSFTTTDQLGQTDHRIAVYLRRGRVLEGLYFDLPNGRQPAVDGQATVASIVRLFEGRVAALPSSVTGG